MNFNLFDIDSFDIDLCVTSEESHCYISNGMHSASLEFLRRTGVLVCFSSDTILPVPYSTIQKIDKFVEQHGYY